MTERSRDWDGVLWRALVESSPDVVLVFDTEGTITFVNGMRPPFEGRQALGAKIWEFVPDPQPEQMLQNIRNVADTRRPLCHEAPGYRADGSIGWYESRIIPLVIDGKVDRFLISARDITDRKLAVEQLEANEKRFRAIVEHGSDCISLIDEQGRVTYASPALTRALGYTSEEVLGRVALDFIHPDDRERALTGRRSAPGSVSRTMLRMRHKDGTWSWTDGTSTNLLHDPGIRALVSNRRDVTAQKQEEERLSFLAAVVSQVNEPILITTRDNVLRYWNEAASRLFGWTAQEAVGREADELLQPRYLHPRGYDDVVSSVKSTGAWRGEVALRAKSGDEVVVESSVRLLADQGSAVTVMKDVTARKQLEDQLRQSQKMEAIGLLAGGVAHDFNNLLAVIMGFTELAARKLPPGHLVGEQLEEVIDAARRGGELTRKLLAFSRKQIIQPRPLDARAAVDDFSRMLGRIVGEDVELVVDGGSDSIVVRADAVQLEQVLLNLCTNARQAMPQGGRLRLATRAVAFDDAFVARHPWSRVGTFAEIVVSDTGIGMDEATRAHVFEPFFTTKREGTGLGLATVYGIVQQHGGFVHVESVPGAGTTFRVFLPASDDAMPAMTAARDGRLNGGARGHESILLAEDEPSLRLLVTSTLSELGYRVIPTGDGEEAVREYAQRASDIALVVMDVVMPRLDAREAYERMRGIRPDVKVLFTTGYAPEFTRLAELLETRRMPILEKPFTPQALAAKVRSAIDG